MGRVRNGSKVRIVNEGSSNNKKGDIGIVTMYNDDDDFRVQVEGRTPFSNWHGIEEVEVLEY